MESMVTEENKSISSCDGLLSFNLIFNYDRVYFIIVVCVNIIVFYFIHQESVLALLGARFCKWSFRNE
jgi:hypothetical protein